MTILYTGQTPLGPCVASEYQSLFDSYAGMWSYNGGSVTLGEYLPIQYTQGEGAVPEPATAVLIIVGFIAGYMAMAIWPRVRQMFIKTRNGMDAKQQVQEPAI